MNDASTPGLWPFIYDRVVVHWRSTVIGVCGALAVVIPILGAQGFGGKYVSLAGAIVVAITSALSKDK